MAPVHWLSVEGASPGAEAVGVSFFDIVRRACGRLGSGWTRDCDGRNVVMLAVEMQMQMQMQVQGCGGSKT